MYLEKVEIGGSIIDEDPLFRIHRIHRVIGYAQALANIANNENIIDKINRFYDYKGILTITWNSKPSVEEMEYFQVAWESIVTDYESESVEHEVEYEQ